MKRILQNHGIDPAPERSQRTPWKTFLLTHWAGLAAADFFTVEVLTLAGQKRYLVFFVIELRTRRVHIAGIHPQPDGAWVEQMALCNITGSEWRRGANGAAVSRSWRALSPSAASATASR